MKMSKGKTIGLVLGVIVFATIMLVPLEGLSHEGQIGVAITLLASIFWIFEVLPYAYTGLLACMLFVALKTTDFATAFSGFAQSSIWMIIFAFLLARAIEKCGLGRRIGLIILNMFKKLSFAKLILTFIALVFIGNLFVPSVSAYVVIEIGVLQGILVALGQPTDKRTTLSASIGCFIGILGLVNGRNFISGDIGNSVLTVLMSTKYGMDMTYMQFLLSSAILIPLPLIFTFFYVKKMYKPDIDFDNPELYVKLKADLNSLGALRGKELFTAIFSIVVLVLWLTNIGSFGVQLATGLVAFVLILPGVGVLDYDDFGKIQYPMFVFIGTAVSIGTVLSALGIDAWVADLLMSLSIFNSSSYFVVASALFLLIVVFHIFMESLGQISLFTPIIMKMGILPPHQVTMIMSMGSHVYQFPFQSAPIALSLGFGLVDGKEVSKYGICLSVLLILQTLAVIAFGWPWVPGF